MSATNRSRNRRFDGTPFAVLFAITALAAPAWGQQRAEAKPAPSETIVRTYEITDLVQAGRDYPYDSTIVPVTQLVTESPQFGGGGQSGGGGQGLFSQLGKKVLEHDHTDTEMALDIINLIQESIARESWLGKSGKIGSIARYGSKLVISHTPETHDQIGKLLGELRKTTGNVTVRATWVRPRADQPGKVDAAALSQLVQADPSTVAYQAQTTCFSGQTIHLAAGHARTGIVNAVSVVGTGAVGYNPSVTMVHIGAILQINMVLGDDRETAIIDLRSIVSEDHSKAKGAEDASVQVGSWSAQGGLGEGNAGMLHVSPIDRLDIAVQHFGTTMKVPLNTPVIVGGMTMPGRDEAPGEPAVPLYLVVEIVSAP